jgi:hypothetical protein
MPVILTGDGQETWLNAQGKSHSTHEDFPAGGELSLVAATMDKKYRARGAGDNASSRPLQPMSEKLSAAKVQRFEAHIKKNYDGVFFELMITRNLLVKQVLELTWIIVQDRKQGVGTAIMRELCEFADRHAAEITLKPASRNDYAATTSRGRLIRFYKRFGFAKDKGKPDHFVFITTMSRKPVG